MFMKNISNEYGHLIRIENNFTIYFALFGPKFVTQNFITTLKVKIYEIIMKQALDSLSPILYLSAANVENHHY